MNAKDADLSLFAGTPAPKQPPRPALWRSVWRNAVLRRLVRILGWLSLAGCIIFGILYAVMRLWLFPWLGENSGWVAEKLSSTIGAPVSIEGLKADWAGMRPRLHLAGLTIRSGERETLQLKEVNATLSWMSLPQWMPYFHKLEIIGPEIVVERGKDGILTVAGIRREKRGNPIDWLFGQSQIAVRDATLDWNDALRDAPPLRLTEVQFTFKRGILDHRLELQGKPPGGLAAKFEVSGKMRRHDSATPKGGAGLEGIAGRLKIKLDDADIGGWSTWVDYPVPFKGRGRIRLYLNSDGKGADELSADLDLTGVETLLASGSAPLRFTRFSGRVLAHRAPKSMGFGASNLLLESREINLPPAIDFSLELRKDSEGELNGGAVSVSSIDLATFVRLSESLPLEKEGKVRAMLDEFGPKGRMQAFSLEWEGKTDALQGWKIDTKFENISLNARGLIPGMGNMSGWVKGNSQEGAFLFTSQNSYVDLPRVFEQARVPVIELNALGGWNHKGEQLAVKLDRIKVTNAHAEAEASGIYYPVPQRPGEIAIEGKVTRGQNTEVWRYIPIIAGEKVRDWLKGALEGGNVMNAEVTLKGALENFPFRNGKGVFRVAVWTENGQLNYAEGWPKLNNMNGELIFDGPGLSIKSHGGDILGVRVDPLLVKIPDLKEGVMTIDGTAKGSSAEFMRFIAGSPLSAHLRELTELVRPEGDGQLDLTLVMPLREVSRTEVKGHYTFAGNRVRLGETTFWPALEAAEGSVRFNRDALVDLSIHGRLLGGESNITGKPGAGGRGVELSASGQVEAVAARQAFGWPLLAWVSGSTKWTSEMAFAQENVNNKIVVKSSLKGLRSRLPDPFAKEADESWPLEVVAVSKGAGKPWLISTKLGDRLKAEFERDASGSVRGGVGLYQPAPPAPSGGGMQVTASLDKLDIDAWQWSLAENGDEGKGEGSAQNAQNTQNSEGGQDSQSGQDGEATLPVMSFMLDARQVRAFGNTFNALKLRAASNAESWTAQVDSNEVQGVIRWEWGGDGKLKAQLSRLTLSGDESSNQGRNGSGSFNALPSRGLPGLNVKAEEFAVGSLKLGQLEVWATNREGAWQLENLSILHPAARFSGSGTWHPGEQHSMLDFTLDVTNVGQFATSLDYNKVIQGRQAQLKGKLDWKGPPHRINYPTLSGQMELSIKDGKFERIEPGVGRLLGILSLQALPRRMTLDFSDVFSEGFKFDHIEGKATVSAGVLHSDKVEIKGPGARVLMRGQADIAAETQDVQVTVYPSLSGQISIGVGIANPLVGVLTFLAQNASGNPVEKLFSSDYRITGSWFDPMVEKTGSTMLPATTGPRGGRRNQGQPLPDQ